MFSTTNKSYLVFVIWSDVVDYFWNTDLKEKERKGVTIDPGEAHCKYQRYILTRCSVNLLVVFNTMVLKRVFFVIINTCVALIWALMC